jgi:hypothetical protein
MLFSFIKHFVIVLLNLNTILKRFKAVFRAFLGLGVFLVGLRQKHAKNGVILACLVLV